MAVALYRTICLDLLSTVSCLIMTPGLVSLNFNLAGLSFHVILLFDVTFFRCASYIYCKKGSLLKTITSSENHQDFWSCDSASQMVTRENTDYIY